MDETELLDGIQDLSLLSDRQLLERLVRTTERIEAGMTAEQEYLQNALANLDQQWAALQTRIQGWADQILQAVAGADNGDYDSLKATVTSVADAISADATAMSQFALPSVVTDPTDPSGAGDVPEDPTVPIGGGDGPLPPDDGSGDVPPVDVPPVDDGSGDVPPVDDGSGDVPPVDAPPVDDGSGDVPPADGSDTPSNGGGGISNYPGVPPDDPLTPGEGVPPESSLTANPSEAGGGS